MSRVAVLERPGRAAAGVSLAAAVAGGTGLAATVGQVPTVLAGLVATGAYLAALRWFDGPTGASTLFGTVAVLTAAGAATATLVVAVGLAVRTGVRPPLGPDDVLQVVARTTAGLGVVLAVAGAASAATTAPSISRVRAPLLALWYAAIITGAGVAVAAGVVVDFGPVTDALGAVDPLVALEAVRSRNQVTALAARLALVGLVLVPLRLVRTRRLYAGLGDAVRSALAPQRAAEDGSASDSTTSESDTAGLRERLVALGGGTLCLVAAVVATLGFRAPPGVTVAQVVPPVAPLAPVVDGLLAVPPLDVVVLGLFLVELGLIAVHPVLVRVLRFPWRRYERRAVRAAVPAIGVVLSAALGPTAIAVLRRTPALHFVYAFPGGRTIAVENGRLRLVSGPVSGSGLTRASEPFLATLSTLVDAVGPVALPLAPVFGSATVLFVTLLSARVAWSVVGRLTSGPVVAGWFLLAAAVGAALAGGPTVAVLVGGAGGVLLWDADAVRRSLAERVDPAATTTRGELVRVGGTVVVLAVAVVVALGARRLTAAARPGLAARPPWQVVLALGAVLVGTGVAALLLMSRTTASPER